MGKEIKQGQNRTGIEQSSCKEEMLETRELGVESSEPEMSSAKELRSFYYQEKAELGSVPPPVKVSAKAKAMIKKVQGIRPEVLMDKVGERLAFERMGTRLYEVLIEKMEHMELPQELSTDSTFSDLKNIRDEELSHFQLLRKLMSDLGGDPSAETPCADAAGVASSGILKVIADPKSSLSQSFNAILSAESTDNNGWETLILLFKEAGYEDYLPPLQQALEEEQRHVQIIRQCLEASLMNEAKTSLSDSFHEATQSHA